MQIQCPTERNLKKLRLKEKNLKKKKISIHFATFTLALATLKVKLPSKIQHSNFHKMSQIAVGVLDGRSGLSQPSNVYTHNPYYPGMFFEST